MATAESAAIYRVKFLTWPLRPATELEYVLHDQMRDPKC
jgi:hypothetical protein